MHSLDQFVLAVPDLAPAQKFYCNFGLDVQEKGKPFALKTFGHDQPGARWSKAASKETASPVVRLLTPRTSAA